MRACSKQRLIPAGVIKDDDYTAGLNPVEAFALVGVIGVGAQWLAWRIQMPAIVLMLGAGLIIGPLTGIFIPSRDIGDLVGPMISVAVAVILFEGGLTLNLHALQDAAKGRAAVGDYRCALRLADLHPWPCITARAWGGRRLPCLAAS